MNVRRSWIGTVAAIAAGMVNISGLPAQAVQLTDGKTYFVQPPRFVGASATYTDAYAWSSTYYFTLTLLENAGEPLQKLVITQENAPDYPDFELQHSEAFERNGSRHGAQIPLKTVTLDPKTRTITIIFDPPVLPGRTITIALSPVRNPSLGGVYLYGVTAYPAGEQAYGQFLGFGRIHIYDHFRRGLFRW